MYDYERRTGAATPLPTSFPPDEIGLMTKEEFLEFRNPGGKWHESESYDVTITRLNEDWATPVGSVGNGGRSEIRVWKLNDGYELKVEDKVVAIVHAGTAYYDAPRMKNRIPRTVPTRGGEYVDLEIEKYRQVKYLSEVEPLIRPIAKKNEAQYPVILQRLIVKGEPMTVRAESQPVLNKGVSLAILNSQGLRVATASDEWGATLLMVVQEYRGKGLGKVIGGYWYEYNPRFRSGGFTDAGQRNALALWSDRVREFGARGWYSQLVRDGRLTDARVKEILKGIGQRPPPRAQPEETKATGKKLVYADDITFVVYDRAFLDEPDEKFIHGFGFFRDNNRGVFLYRIEYDRPFAGLVTNVALQMSKDNGESIYDAGHEGMSDMLENVDSIPGVERDGDYLTVTRDLLPLKALAQVERRTRKPLDPYGEKHSLLLEMAESKW